MPQPARPSRAVDHVTGARTRTPDHPRLDERPPARRAGAPGRLRAAWAGALVAGLTVAGCAAPMQQSTVDTAPPGPAAAPEGGLDGFYGQEVAWETCAEMECATVLAPLDWDDPSAGAIELAVKRAPATGDEAIGSLLINPGGPGGSGVEFVEYAAQSFSDRLRGAYDVVGFDPRGVGGSTAVDCGDDAAVDAVLTADIPRSQEDLEALRDATRALGEQCLAVTGPLLGEVDTVSAARDMDLLRAVLGDEKLNFAGFSYGTFLGATYAGLYPERVGRLLLDGAVDPSITVDELITGQAEGFEDALRAYVEYCQATEGCPLPGDVEDGLQRIAELMDRVAARPLETELGAPVNGTLAFYGLAVTLYDDASWPYLTMALDEAIRQGTGDTFLELANYYLDRTPEGAYTSNAMMAFTAVNCLDYPAAEARTYAELEAAAEELAVVAPTFARNFVMGVGCEEWPFQPTVERAPIEAAGAPPILVVGTTGDPATPYEWSVALADQLESGHLLTFEGEGHTAYGRGNDCVTDAVDDYLIEGAVPEEGLVC